MLEAHINMETAEKAFLWIVGILRKHNVPFRISGGMAARAYGSKRALADIDIDIPEEKFDDILPDVKEFMTDAPERFVGNGWDLLIMVLNYHGQAIDISGDKVKIQNPKTSEWTKLDVNFSDVENIEIFGISVPVIKKEKLIAYKKILSRPVDILDIAELSR